MIKFIIIGVTTRRVRGQRANTRESRVLVYYISPSSVNLSTMAEARGFLMERMSAVTERDTLTDCGRDDLDIVREGLSHLVRIYLKE